jgi:hypothetical protein
MADFNAHRRLHVDGDIGETIRESREFGFVEQLRVGGQLDGIAHTLHPGVMLDRRLGRPH